MHITKNYIKKIVKSHQNINSQKFIKIKTAFKIRNALNNTYSGNYEFCAKRLIQ